MIKVAGGGILACHIVTEWDLGLLLVKRNELKKGYYEDNERSDPSWGISLCDMLTLHCRHPAKLLCKQQPRAVRHGNC